MRSEQLTPVLDALADLLGPDNSSFVQLDLNKKPQLANSLGEFLLFTLVVKWQHELRGNHLEPQQHSGAIGSIEDCLQMAYD
jgi:hypothetical protein